MKGNSVSSSFPGLLYENDFVLVTNLIIETFHQAIGLTSAPASASASAPTSALASNQVTTTVAFHEKRFRKFFLGLVVREGLC